ncbi:MAG TPA: hypothetical protein VKB47_13395 [Terracidiphilus sp.]|nr:hypothetical protein [Terracidiphilus sp.]
MNEQLHPLTLPEILDRTAQLYRARFLIFLGIGMIPAGTVFVFAAGIFAFIAWMGANARTGGSTADVLVWVFLGLMLILVLPVGLAASALGAAAMSDASARMFLGETITIRNAYRTAWQRGWRYMWLYALQALVIAGAPAAVFLVGIIGMTMSRLISGPAGADSPLLGGLAFLLILALAVFAGWMLLRLCLAFPACVVEQTTAWKALKRGVLLSRGTKGRIFVLYLLGIVLNQVLVMGVTIPAIIVLALVPGLQGPAHAQTAGMVMLFVTWGAYFAVRALTKPIYGIAITLFYFDQRIRKEGFDIEWMMQQAGWLTVPTPAAAPAEVQSAAIEGTPVTATAEPKPLREVGLAAKPDEATG